VQVEQRIAVRFSSPKLLWKPSVRCDLMGREHRFESVPAVVAQRIVAGEPREFCHLHHPAGAMVVFRVPLLFSARRGRHPAQILGKPIPDAAGFIGARAGAITEIARATSTRWMVSMIPVDLPVVMP